MIDYTFQRNVDRAAGMLTQQGLLPADDEAIQSIMQTLVWPALNRFARFDNDKKAANYKPFVQLCDAISYMQRRYDKAGPLSNQVIPKDKLPAQTRE